MVPQDTETTLTNERLKELLHYNPATGLFIRLTCNNQHKKGDQAGYITPYGYIRIGVDGHAYMGHRLAHLYMTGSWPKNRIDHENKIRSDNRWDNLRDASDAQNSANCKVRRTNFLGVKGVRLHECGKYTARIRGNGKSHYLGLFGTIELAVEAYTSKAKELFGEFAAHEHISKEKYND